VTFPVTVLSPPILYNGSQGENSGKEAAMNGKTAGNRGRWLVRALVAVAVVVVLAVAFGMHVQTDISHPVGLPGSVTYRQEMAFLQCLRSHGMPNLPTFGPGGGSITLPNPQNGAGGEPSESTVRAEDACQRLAPRGRETRQIRITL
jgi:hypothetical protein